MTKQEFKTAYRFIRTAKGRNTCRANLTELQKLAHDCYYEFWRCANKQNLYALLVAGFCSGEIVKAKRQLKLTPDSNPLPLFDY